MFLADGFEEAEALVTLDMLRRAHIDVKTVGIGSVNITGAHAIKVEADMSELNASYDNCDGIILPGGMPGTENLFSSRVVRDVMKHCFNNEKLIAAICAAPIIPGRDNLLEGKCAVCFPGFENELKGCNISDVPCVRDNNIITAKGAGAVFEFSYEIISYIADENTARSVLAVIQHKGL